MSEPGFPECGNGTLAFGLLCAGIALVAGVVAWVVLR